MSRSEPHRHEAVATEALGGAPQALEQAVADNAQVSISRAQRVIDTMKQFATVSELLRILGAAVMVGALSMFMMQGWLEGNDTQRYLKLLAETLLLTAGGLGLSAWLKEHKGARLFFGLSLASVAANFTILGALIYSVVQFDGLLGSYPNFAAWTSASPVQVVGVTALALAVLIAVTRLAFSVLARPAAGWLTTAYLLGGATLLVPVRSSVWACVLAIAVLAYVLWALTHQHDDRRVPDTMEGKFSSLMLMLPPVILCVRSFYFYRVEELALACMAGGVFFVFRYLSLRSSSVGVQRVLDWVSVPLVLVTAVALADGLEFLPRTLVLPVMALVILVMTFEMTLRRLGKARSTWFSAMGTLLACAALLSNQAFYDGIGVAFAGIVGVTFMLCAGYWLRKPLVTCFGWITAFFLSIDNVVQFFDWFTVSNWMLLSILGASAIVMASLLDRYGAALKLKLDVQRAEKLGR